MPKKIMDGKIKEYSIFYDNLLLRDLLQKCGNLHFIEL